MTSRLGVGLLLLAAVAPEAACSAMPRLWITNATDSVVGLHVDGDIYTYGWQDKVIFVRSAESRSLLAGAVLADHGRLTLQAAGCDYAFEPPYGRLPSLGANVAAIGVTVRLGRSGAPVLIPRISKGAPPGPYTVESVDELRVEPISKACPPATAPP
jgi:hypothetical protein